MQIRLTVTLGPRSGQGAAGTAGAGATCDVVVTAPSGTPLSAVTGALVSTAASACAGAGGGEPVADPAAVYAGMDRLDPHRQVVGEPPLLDGAVISLHGPAAPTAPSDLTAYGSAKARLHVTAGPDAGGVHLLQGGRVEIGRSSETDVPLDDPDVSRRHCALTVTDGGAVTVADLGSTNGTSLDGVPVGTQPVLVRPGAALRLGETAVRLDVPAQSGGADASGFAAVVGGAAGSGTVEGGRGQGPATLEAHPDGNGALRLVVPQDQQVPPAGGAAGQAWGPGSARAAARDVPSAPLAPPRAAPSPGAERSLDSPHAYAPGEPFPDGGGTHGSGVAQHARYAEEFPGEDTGTEPRRTRGLGAWARRFAGARADEEEGEARRGAPSGAALGHGSAGSAPYAGPYPSAQSERCPDPAALLLTALGPGIGLWEREPGHPDAMTVRIGTGHGGGGRPEGPVTVDLREAGALGLAGPRPRLAGLARSVLAQLAALHGPSTLEIVLLTADRAREAETRGAEWAWLGWLPHLRPAHGQDCRLLTAYDHDQAKARTTELLRRLGEERRTRQAAPAGSGPAGSGPAGTGAARPGSGPYTLLVVDGDPGSAELREAVNRLASEGPEAGIHTLCLAETPAATPTSPLSTTVEAAYAASTAFRECGAIAMLSGAVATAARVVRRDVAASGAAAARHGLAAGGAVATIDAVSAAWAERFGRALAPLREPEGTAARTGTAARPTVTLPRSSRLLDELGLARATPAALLARWSEPESSTPGRATLVFGAGPRGPLEAELGQSRAHVLITGGPGAGKTELVRSLAASLCAGERPDRLQLLLLDGDGDSTRDGLRHCLELPHARGHLASGDPARMREFAQSLSGELKRRAELVPAGSTYEQYAREAARPAPRVVSQRQPSEEGEEAAAQGQGQGRAGGTLGGQRPAETGDLVTGPAADGTGATLQLNRRGEGTGSGTSADTGKGTGSGTGPGPGSGRSPSAGLDAGGTADRTGRGADPAEATGATAQALPQGPLPRLVVLVDDFDTLVDPALGNPGRPAAGSVLRALESIARDGARLGVHVVAASGRQDCTAGTAVAQTAALRAELTGAATASAPSGEQHPQAVRSAAVRSAGAARAEEAVPGRGTLTDAADPAGGSAPDAVTEFQAGRVTGRIPRTSTLRPTVVPLDWARAGDPPARRPVRELGNGPTDLALLASAIDRAAQSLGLGERAVGDGDGTTAAPAATGSGSGAGQGAGSRSGQDAPREG